MPINFNRRKSIKQQIWMALIFATVVGCAVLVYASLCYGQYHFSEPWKRRDFTTVKEKLTEEKCSLVCETEECVQESNLLWNQINPSVDPCENFYEFACGKFLEKYGTNESNILQTRMKEQMKLKLKDILELIETNDNAASGKLKIMYDSCIRRNSSDMQAVLATKQILSQLGIPNWPHLDSDFEFDDQNLTNVLSHFISFKEYAFLDVSTKFLFRKMPCEEANATIVVEKGSYESKDASVRKYLVKKVLQYFNLGNESILRMWNESEAILRAIVHLKLESERISNENNEFRQISIDCAMEDETGWKHLCELLKYSVDVVGANTGISNRFLNLMNTDVYFAQNIFPVLSNFSHRSISNFLALNLFLNHLDDLNFYFRLLLRKDTTSLLAKRGIFGEIGNWQHCIEWLMKKLYIPLGHEYMKSVITKSVFEELDDLIREIMLETAKEISKQNWLTKTLREKMTVQTEYLEHSVAMLKDVLTNTTFIDGLFREFHPSDASFMYNVFKYQRYSKIQEMRSTFRAMYLDWFDSSLLTPDASSGGGKIDLQFGILMPPIYRSNLEKIINTVTLSTIIAHEIGHDYERYIYRFQNQDIRAKNFTDDVRSCISDQYSQFKFKFSGKNVKGKRYVSENVPDLIAISVIDKFIEKYSNPDKAFSLPAFPYFTQQMLYISSVQMFCAANTQRDEELNQQFSSHSLPVFRVLGMMQNSKGFSKAFNCPEGSYMNPPTKCAYFVDN